jgi:hypothetical protein
MAPKQATSCGIRDRLSKELLPTNQEAAECGNKESKALMLGNRNALEEAEAQFLNAARVRSAALMPLAITSQSTSAAEECGGSMAQRRPKIGICQPAFSLDWELSA